jgi:hypothetical protein
MRIVSEFHDYYDIAQLFGQDLSLVFVRETFEKEWKEKLPDRVNAFEGLGHAGSILNELNYCVHYVVFCGKFYGIVELSVSKIDHEGHYKTNRVFCYDIDAIDKFVDQYCSKNAQKKYNRKVEGSAKRWRHKNARDMFISFFERCHKEKQNSNWLKLCIDNLSPVAIIKYECYDSIIVFNARLADVEFFRQIDPYTAFQEIEMWMNNLAKPEKPMPVISDELKVETHGMDKKWSFRKPPEKPRKAK